MNCDTCSKRPDPVPFAVHESAMARAERAHRRLWIVIIVLIILLAGSNAAWIYYESQWEVTETRTEIQQDTSDGGNIFIVCGNYNGEAESYDDNADTEP